MKRIHNKQDILLLNDEAFIDNAYVYALERKADKEGKSHFLSLLRAGTLSKDEILYMLQNSKEGRTVREVSKRERFLHKLTQIHRIPIVGYFSQTIHILLTLPTLKKNLEQYTQTLTKEIQKNTFSLDGKADFDEYIMLRATMNRYVLSHKKHYENKNILICCNAYPPNFIGGAELIAHYQALELQKKGYTVKVFTGDLQSDTEHYGIKKESFDGIEVYRVKLTPADFDAGTVNFRHKKVEKHFEHLIEKFNPSIVHMHNIMGLSIALGSIAKKYAIKTVMTLHDGWGFCYRNTMMRENGTFCHDFKECHACMPSFLDEEMGELPISMRQDYFALAFQDIDLFISPSDYLKEQYVKAGFNETNIKVLTNGIDIDKFNLPKIKSDKIRFTFIGHLGEHKGVKLILEALTLLKSKDNIHLNIVGEGGLKDALQTYIDAHDLAPYVKLLGKVPNHDIPSLFTETDVYILPSQCPENQPVSITEAFASKVPVIGTDLGGIKELVTHEETGLLFPMGDTESLAQCMTYFIENQSKATEYGENAYTFIKEKSFENQISKLIPLYNQPLTFDKKEKILTISCVGSYLSEVSKKEIIRIKQTYPNIHIVLHKWLKHPYACDALWFTEDTINDTLPDKYLYVQKPYFLDANHSNIRKYIQKLLAT